MALNVSSQHEGILAEDYTVYTMAIIISKYLPPFIIIFGLIGNTLAFLVMLQPHNRVKSCCNYMAALSGSDNCMMLITLHAWLITISARKPHVSECWFFAYVFNLFSVICIYLIVFMTLDRFIAVRFPLQMSALCTVKRARVSIVVLCLTSVVYVSPYAVSSGYINGFCSSIKDNTVFIQIYSLVNVFLTSVIPFCGLLFLNVVIIITLRQRRQSLRRLGIIAERSTDSQLTLMLVLVSVAFLVLTLPVGVRYILALTLHHEDNPYHKAVYNVVYQFSQKLHFANSAVNFYLYCLGGSKFRGDLRQLVGCGRQRRHHHRSSSRRSTVSGLSADIMHDTSHV